MSWPRTGSKGVYTMEGRYVLRQIGLAAVAAVLLILPPPVAADNWTGIMERLAADGFDRRDLALIFSRQECRYDPEAMAAKIKALLRSRLPQAQDHAAALRDQYRRNYLSSYALRRAGLYLEDKWDLLREIESRYGVQAEVVVAIIHLETNLGRNTGRWVVFNRLASMAAADLESIRPYLPVSLLGPEAEEFARQRCREKAKWAYEELRALLRYSGQLGQDPLSFRGSPYGAIGLCQFLPSNVLAYGVDADRDGRADPFSVKDALFSVANFLRAHGWRQDLEGPGRREVIFRYNHSSVYAETVLAAAEKIRGSRTRSAGRSGTD